MGGNALKEVKTRRYHREEHLKVEAHVLSVLNKLFSPRALAPIKSYTSKESFGDLDILILQDDLPNDWHLAVADALQSKQWIRNGNVVSFEHAEFQVDVIATTLENFVTSLNYFAYNDLGNLLGRVAHMMGLKLGHDGLSYNWKIETYQFRNVILSKDWPIILNVLGYDADRYYKGFDTLEDIFQFVASGEFFDPDVYLLHNRNHNSRTRDAKRKTYMEFLRYCEALPPTGLHRGDKKNWLPYLFKVLPDFKANYDEVQAEWDQERDFRERFNGAAVAAVTGLKGPALGDFMKWLKEQHAPNLRKKVMILNPEVVSAWIAHQHKTYEVQR